VTAQATSPATGRCYGIARVCRVWELPRSSFYAARQVVGVDGTRAEPSPTRRGPKPAISDQDLLAAIRADLARSPWTGEGHRKVWARLRAMDGIRVSRKRVLRLMREHALLSPHRSQPRPAAAHERQIITAAPNVMWAIDATQVATVEDGKVWLFGVVEHWNAEMLGWHVAKHGTRYEAIQALGMAVRQQFGGLDAGAARGLALRHDHGSNFMADVFQKQIGFWGMAPSYAFVAEPETNGCIERLFRTLKEQAIHGRIFQTIDDVRGAVRAFVARYNTEWLVEKNGYRSPADIRATWQEQTLRRAA
jgi:putative transposase